MSRKSGQNTLFNYFLKSPTMQTKSVGKETPENNKATFKDRNSDSEDATFPTPKRRKLSSVTASNGGGDSAKNLSMNFSSPSSSLKILPESKQLNLKTPQSCNETPKPSEKQNGEGIEIVYEHTKLDFLKEDHIKDAKGRKPNDPNYDQRTLFVPDKFLSQLSPGFRQWWEFKSRYFDCVILFKVGKFYEFYHMDADIAVKVLDCNYMKGEFAHSGFPEISCAKMTAKLVGAGYKVVRIEQTETPEMMTNRCKMKGTTKFDRVVKREACRIIHRGTQTAGTQHEYIGDHRTNYMLAICEKDVDGKTTYGVCFAETSIGELTLGEFSDNENSARLRTLLLHYPPVLVLYDRNQISKRTYRILKTLPQNADYEWIPDDVKSYKDDIKTPEAFLTKFIKKYFEDEKLPKELESILETGESIKWIVKKEYTTCYQAFRICLWYLQYCLVDHLIIPIVNFKLYVPPDISIKSSNPQDIEEKKCINTNSMVLDSVTLSNLRITGSDDSLLSLLDQCCTKFGKRLLHKWVCSPSHDIEEIKNRQVAVKELMESCESEQLRCFLTKISDVERQISQICVFGMASTDLKHPEQRAILFEEKTYSKKKIQAFISLLKDFEHLANIPTMLSEFQKSKLLKRISQLPPHGKYPDLKPTLIFFQNAFNHELALEKGTIAPERGVDEKFDSVEKKIENLQNELEDYRSEQCTLFGCDVKYFGTDKKRYQLEVPEKYANEATSDYFFEGQKKSGNSTLKRFTTSKTKEFLRQMMYLEEERNSVLKNIMNRIFQKFSNHFALWKKCVDCVAEIDVLLSLAAFGKTQYVNCMPEISEERDTPFLEIEEAYHPSTNHFENFIPNDIKIGQSNTLLLLTGPNMGGKSTLMRVTGLICILAHMGSNVPARSCKMSLIDRIFTRLGAQDDILAGNSTFFVELLETSSVISDASNQSLVLLDELGRGTATHDGTAIATAVANFLANSGCRSIFSTHYYNLLSYFHGDKRVSFGNMSCMVENENDEDPTQEAVTFLYKLAPGACSKSFGFNAAKLAGMPNEITKRARDVSKRFAENILRKKLFNLLLTTLNAETIRNVAKTNL